MCSRILFLLGRKLITSLLVMSVKEFRESQPSETDVNIVCLCTMSHIMESLIRKCRTPSHSIGLGFKSGQRDGI